MGDEGADQGSSIRNLSLCSILAISVDGCRRQFPQSGERRLPKATFHLANERPVNLSGQCKCFL